MNIFSLVHVAGQFYGKFLSTSQVARDFSKKWITTRRSASLIKGCNLVNGLLLIYSIKNETSPFFHSGSHSHTSYTLHAILFSQFQSAMCSKSHASQACKYVISNEYQGLCSEWWIPKILEIYLLFRVRPKMPKHSNLWY